MDLDVSQDSFAFSDVVPPSHVSDLQSFSDLEFSDTEISLTESSRTLGPGAGNSEDAVAQNNWDCEEKNRQRYRYI